MTAPHWLLAALGGALWVVASTRAQAPPEGPQQTPDAAVPMADRPRECAGCHELAQHDTYTLADGEKRSAYVDPDTARQSVHNDQVACRDCHPRSEGYPHDPIAAATWPAYRRALAMVCSRCHYKTQQRIGDSVHKVENLEGDEKVVTCVTCHGAHDVFDPDSAPGRMAAVCADCHEEEAEIYEDSVHGKSLAEGAKDAPRCYDCHGAHTVESADDEAFHAASYLICARCHGDEDRMQEYDLNANVLDTYLDDFHGVSNHLYIEVGYVPERPMATCADCHGAHDVASFDASEGSEAMRQRTAEMCGQCHEGADASFAGAWLGHSEPTLKSAPWVWMVIWGYRILIPLMVLGMLLHIFLHFYRAAMGPPVDEE